MHRLPMQPVETCSMHRLPAEQRTAESAAGRSHRESTAAAMATRWAPTCGDGKGCMRARACVRRPAVVATPARRSYEDLKLEWGRYQMWLTWLEWCTECTGWTLVSDARDVFFQRSPFAGDALTSGCMLHDACCVRCACSGHAALCCAVLLVSTNYLTASTRVPPQRVSTRTRAARANR